MKKDAAYIHMLTERHARMYTHTRAYTHTCITARYSKVVRSSDGRTREVFYVPGGLECIRRNTSVFQTTEVLRMYFKELGYQLG